MDINYGICHPPLFYLSNMQPLVSVQTQWTCNTPTFCQLISVCLQTLWQFSQLSNFLWLSLSSGISVFPSTCAYFPVCQENMGSLPLAFWLSLSRILMFNFFFFEGTLNALFGWKIRLGDLFLNCFWLSSLYLLTLSPVVYLSFLKPSPPSLAMRLLIPHPSLHG